MRGETFKLSRDKHFVERLHDVVGLYLNPPDKSLVCVDEKSQIQALDRTQPGLPLKKGRQAPAREILARAASPGSSTRYPDFELVVELGGALVPGTHRQTEPTRICMDSTGEAHLGQSRQM